MQKLIEAAVGQRLQAQGSMTHYEKKLVEEQVKLDNAKNYADIVQDELVVSRDIFFLLECMC